MDDALALFGTDEPVPPTVALRAGPLDLAYRAGKLLPVRLGPHEIWHGVAFTVRDTDWGTPEPVILSETVEAGSDRFRIEATGLFPVSPPIDLRVTIEGRPDGSVRFAGEAVPRGDVMTNRLGLCVLHPMVAGGRPVEVEHEDGRVSRSTWPVLVPSWPPFTLVRAIRHAYADGAWASCRLEGDVFETEDQRNNADPSFKTYGRSNMMPRPYRLAAGTAIRHAADLRLDRAPAAPALRRLGPDSRPEPDRVTVTVGAAGRPAPRLGLAVLPEDTAAPERALADLAALRPDQLHLTLWPDGAAVDWHGLGRLLTAAGAALRVDLVGTGIDGQGAALSALAEALGAAGIRPESLAVFPCEAESVATARVRFPGTRIGGGTPHMFAQLNRLERLGPVDFVTFTSCPLIHGAEDEAVMLNLASLPSLLDTVRAGHPGLPVRLGPSAIGLRRSPLGAQPETDGRSRRALAQNDPRSRALFGAAWMLGYAASAVRAGVETLTLGSLTGGTGLAETRPDGSLAPYPAFGVLARLAARCAHVQDVAVSEEGAVAALAFGRPHGVELLLANLSGRPRTVEVAGWRPEGAAILDAAASADPAARRGDWTGLRRPLASPLFTLPPYAVARLDGAR